MTNAHESARVMAALPEGARIDAGEAPTAADLADAPVLSDWKIGVDGRGLPLLIGVVIGHPRIADGHIAYTSTLIRIDAGASWARTVSRYYRLGPQHGESRQ
jgi:hypothetical protein